MRGLLLFAAVWCAAASLRAAETPAQEIEFLLQQIHDSKVRFVRSGQEYTGPEGAAHLRNKLARAGKGVKSAEDFINGIASKSYLTGEVYMVKFPDGKMAPTAPWLTAVLAKHRVEATPKQFIQRSDRRDSPKHQTRLDSARLQQNPTNPKDTTL